MPKKDFKNGGFPPLKYCSPAVVKQPAKERLYANSVSKLSIQPSNQNFINLDNNDEILEIAVNFN